MTSVDEFVLRGPEVKISPLVGHLGEYYVQKLQEYGDKVAQVTKVQGVEKSVTFKELLHYGKVVSCVLKEHGLKSGDTVMICCMNTLDFAPVFLGALFSGVACSPVYPLAGTDDLKHLLGVIKPSLVLCDSDSHRSLVEAVAQSDLLPSIMALDVLARRLLHSTADCTRHFQLADIADVHDHVALVLTSSGTTGRPKGVEISLATLMLIAKTEEFNILPPGAVGLSISGPYWASGIISQLLFMVVGAKLVLMRQFQEDAFLAVIQEHKVNFSTVGSDQITALAKCPRTEDYDVSSIMFFAFGGSRVSQAMVELAEERLKKRIINGYGMTEAFLLFQVSRVNGKPGSIGTLAKNTLAKVVDVDTGKNVGPNCEGELCFKTPVKLKGYRGNPEATRQLFDDEGFIKSGDIGYYDEDGYFYVIDRLKQLIKYKNIQVPAIDIEEVLLNHVDVKEAAVVGIQNEVDTEHATAFIVRQPGATVTAQDLVKLVEGKLPKFKWLYGGVVFMESLPKTGSGKVQQRALKAMHASRSS